MTKPTGNNTSLLSAGYETPTEAVHPLKNTSTCSKVKVGLYNPVHQTQVYRLYEKVFGPKGAQRFKARWQWSQEKNLYSSHNLRLVLTDEEQVVGFLGAIPFLYRVGGSEVIAHTPCDYMVHPQYRFHGIKLLKEFFRMCENCVSCDDMPATIKVTKWLGATEIGSLVRYAKLLDGRALQLREEWKWVPAAFLWPLTQMLRRSDELPSKGLSYAFRLETPSDFDERFERFFQKMSTKVPVMLVKGLDFLKWRYGPQSPHSTRDIGLATDAKGEILGYIVTYNSREADHQGYIFDFQSLPGNTGVAETLLNHGVNLLRRQGAWTVRFHHLSSPFSMPLEALQKAGFMPRGGHRVFVKFKDQRLTTLAQEPQNWNYNFGDSEASHAII